MNIKICSVCQQSKPLTYFGISRRYKDERRPDCRVCHNRKRREARLDNLQVSRGRDSQYQKIYGLTPRGRFHHLKANSLRSGMPININADAFVKWYESQSQTCYYCLKGLVNGGARSGLTSLTIDRKDNNEGYTLNNIVLCCRRCNLMKGDWLTEQQTLEIAQKYFVP